MPAGWAKAAAAAKGSRSKAAKAHGETFGKRVTPQRSSSLARLAECAEGAGMKKLLPIAALLALAVPAFAQTTADPGSPASYAPVDPQRLSDWTRALAADEMQGRAPGTEGETRTVAWLDRAIPRARP